MQLDVFESPTQQLWCGRSAALSAMLDRNVWDASTQWKADLNMLLLGIYDTEFRRPMANHMPMRPAPERIERWHVVRAPGNEHHRVALSLPFGCGIVVTRRAMLMVRGRESRQCKVIHMWRRLVAGEKSDQPVSIPPEDRMGCLLYGQRLHATDPHNREYHVDVADNWAIVIHHGPIRPNDDERCELELRAGGVAFVFACIDGAQLLAPPPPLSSSLPAALTLSLPDDLVLFRDLGRFWCLRSRGPYGDPLDDYDAVDTADLMRVRRRCDVLRAFELYTELQPRMTVDPAGARSWQESHLVTQSDFFHRMNLLGMPPSPVDSLIFAYTPGDGRISAIFVSTPGPSAAAISKPVWFIPLRRVPRVLAFVDTTTFFYVDRDESGQILRRASGLPSPLGVASFRFEQRPSALTMLERLGHARSAAETARVLMDTFGTTGALPAAWVALSYFGAPPAADDAPSVDAMDLDDPPPGDVIRAPSSSSTTAPTWDATAPAEW